MLENIKIIVYVNVLFYRNYNAIYFYYLLYPHNQDKIFTERFQSISFQTLFQSLLLYLRILS